MARRTHNDITLTGSAEMLKAALQEEADRLPADPGYRAAREAIRSKQDQVGAATRYLLLLRAQNRQARR